MRSLSDILSGILSQAPANDPVVAPTPEASSLSEVVAQATIPVYRVTQFPSGYYRDFKTEQEARAAYPNGFGSGNVLQILKVRPK